MQWAVIGTLFIICGLRNTDCAHGESVNKSVVNPYSFHLVKDVSPCATDESLLIVIHSSVRLQYMRRRIFLRSSWLNKHNIYKLLGIKAKIVFFLGSPADPASQKFIDYEYEIYKDIVQASFTDSYINNTYKAMTYLKWTAQNCLSAKLLLKIDDDVLLQEGRSSTLKEHIASFMNGNQYIYSGRFIDNIPNRKQESKWYIPYSVFPDKFYPTWFQGLYYFLSPKVCASLYNIALQTTYMFTDDVYVGILVNKFSKKYKINIIRNQNLSTFARPNKNVYDELAPKWANGTQAFFHVPDFSLFWSFFLTNH